MQVCESIYNVGVKDTEIDLFEGQYPVPNGIAYNSYIILDEKIAVMDTVDFHFFRDWLSHLERVLNGREPDYLIISHMEPDHAGSIDIFLSKYPQTKVIGNTKTFQMLKQFFQGDYGDQEIVVKEGDTLELGKHTLTFYTAPLVHWPEVMMTYESYTKTLFSADAFGTFGIEDDLSNWPDEARRYYYNICGKFGPQVKSVLNKISGLQINRICSLHGPLLNEDLDKYVHLYKIWSQYLPEESGITIAYASIYGHTERAMFFLAEQLEKLGEQVTLIDLGRNDHSFALAEAFRYDRLVLASSTYDGWMFTPMCEFLSRLRGKNFQGRDVAFIQNGSWAPVAIKPMKDIMTSLKDITCIEPEVTIKSAMNDNNKQELIVLAEAIHNGGCIEEACD